MPVTRIAIREGKTPEYKQALMDEIYEAMRETVAIKDGDRFMAITEHGSHEFAYGPFLGIDRSDDLVQIQVFWAPGKTVDAKLAMYKKIVERLGSNPGVRPEDVLISVVEAAADNWSFGNGETQFYKAVGVSSILIPSCLRGVGGHVRWIRKVRHPNGGCVDSRTSRRQRTATAAPARHPGNTSYVASGSAPPRRAIHRRRHRFAWVRRQRQAAQYCRSRALQHARDRP